MKYIDVHNGMDVKVTLSDNVQYSGKVVGLDSDYKAVCIEFENNRRSWFYEGTKVTSLASVEPIDKESSSTSTKGCHKIPKFDKSLLNSEYFTGYFNTLVEKYKEEYIPCSEIECIDVHSDGRIVIIDSSGNKGMSKCHENDAFNIEVGLKLAFQRLVDNQSFVPSSGDSYYTVTYPRGNIVEVVYLVGVFSCMLDRAMGNCFRTKQSAEMCKKDIIRKYKKVLEYSGGLDKNDENRK